MTASCKIIVKDASRKHFKVELTAALFGCRLPAVCPSNATQARELLLEMPCQIQQFMRASWQPCEASCHTCAQPAAGVVHFDTPFEILRNRSQLAGSDVNIFCRLGGVGHRVCVELRTRDLEALAGGEKMHVHVGESPCGSRAGVPSSCPGPCSWLCSRLFLLKVNGMNEYAA
jgi:hypothetical protein